VDHEESRGRWADAGVVLTRHAVEQGLHAAMRIEYENETLIRLRRGAFIDRAAFAALGRDDRYRARVTAVLSARNGAVAAGPSAAVLLGLPTIGPWPSDVFVLSRGDNTRRRNGVVEIAQRPGVDVIDHDGLMVTSAAETVLDCSRLLGFLSAVTIADAAIHISRFGSAKPMTALDELWALHRSRLPYHRSLRVHKVLEFADPQADKPLETLSRVRIHELGFPTPVTQYHLHLPRSDRDVFTDFAWPGYGIVGEADGNGKYMGDGPLDGATPAQRVLEEKKRENEIRGLRLTTARWDWGEAWDGTVLREILVEAGLPQVRAFRRMV
jgi:hypothetical protein